MQNAGQVVIVSDSDDDDGDENPHPKRAQQPKRRAAVHRNEQRAKRTGVLALFQSQCAPGVGGEQSVLKDASKKRVSTTDDAKAHGRVGRNELWPDKHSPKTYADLKISAQKLDQIRDWMNAMNPNSPTRPQAGHLLILSGPPGCGKTQAVRLLAEELGYDISEWIPPASVSWKESRYIAGVRGAPHRSSLQHLEDFIVHAVRLPMLSLSVSASATPHSSSRPEPCRPKLLLLHELPHTHDAAARAALKGLLSSLCASRFPAILEVSQSPSGHARDSDAARGASTSVALSGSLHQDLESALETAGAASISLPPVTDKRVSDVLSRVASAEGFSVDKATLARMASSSRGDVRGALLALQMALTGVKPAGSPPRKRRRAKNTAASASHLSLCGQGDAAVEALGSRDGGLSHFHALGRILYNKRTSAGDAADPAQGRWGGGSTSPGGEGPLSGSYGAPRCGNGFAELAAEVWKWEGDVRPELAREKMERDPEDVVARSGLDAMAVLGYLLENYHHFVHEWHVDEAAQAAASLSDALSLLQHRAALSLKDIAWEDVRGSGTVLDTLAASIAVRGFMFANMHRTDNKWLPLKGPCLWAIAQARGKNVQELQHVFARTAAQSGHMYGSAGRATSELLPFAKVAKPGPEGRCFQPDKWASAKGGEVVVQGLSWGTGRAAEQARLGAIECDGESLVGGDAGGGGGEEVDEIEEIEEV